MKNLSIIIALFFLVFTVEAQSVERTKRSNEKKNTNTSVSKSNDRDSKAKVAKASSASRSSTNRSATKPVVSRSTKSSSNTSASGRSGSGNSRAASSQTRTSSSTKASQGSQSGNNRAVNSQTRNSNGNASRSNDSRNSNTVRQQTKSTESRSNGNSREVRQSSGNQGRSNGNSREVRQSSGNQGRNNESGRVNSNRNYNSQSNRNYTPIDKDRYEVSRRSYTTNKSSRVMRVAPNIHYNYQPLEYRRIHNPYRRPVDISIYWNVNMYNNYRTWYPDFNLWYYPLGYRIQTISAYDSYNYIGEVARIYGQVSEVWYSGESRQYYLYVGGPYPYQDFTIILDERDARRFSWDPERYFTNRQLTATGLVRMFEDSLKC